MMQRLTPVLSELVFVMLESKQFNRSIENMFIFGYLFDIRKNPLEIVKNIKCYKTNPSAFASLKEPRQDKKGLVSDPWHTTVAEMEPQTGISKLPQLDSFKLQTSQHVSNNINHEANRCIGAP